MKPTAIINSLIQDFVIEYQSTYQYFYSDSFSPLNVGGGFTGNIEINQGDCGTAALAVGIALELLTGEKVVYYDNGNHGYFGYDGKYYDTIAPEGKDSHEEMFGYDHDYFLMHGLEGQSLEQMWYHFIRTSLVMPKMIDNFVMRWTHTTRVDDIPWYPKSQWPFRLDLRSIQHRENNKNPSHGGDYNINEMLAIQTKLLDEESVHLQARALIDMMYQLDPMVENNEKLLRSLWGMLYETFIDRLNGGVKEDTIAFYVSQGHDITVDQSGNLVFCYSNVNGAMIRFIEYKEEISRVK